MLKLMTYKLSALGNNVREVLKGQNIFIDDESTDIVLIKNGRGENIEVKPDFSFVPNGIQGMASHIGVAVDTSALDFSVILLKNSCLASAVYTRSLCVSPAIIFDRKNTNKGYIKLICVISKNASVFTPRAEADIDKIVKSLAEEFNVSIDEILISFTGIIGKALPTEVIVNNINGLSKLLSDNALESISEAILTTDKRPKQASIKYDDVIITGYAKGAGMIEPNMATLLVYLYTNVKVSKQILDYALKTAVDLSFNSLSVDSDTSTSDTVSLVSTEEVDIVGNENKFQQALNAVCIKLARDVAMEAEGATKLLEVIVNIPTSQEDARFFAKKIVNSPLVKTAIHGNDPNWGRIVMAIGKPVPGSPLLTISPNQVEISIQDTSLYKNGLSIETDLDELSNQIKASTNVKIEVTIGAPTHTATVWGCDLSAEYVRENADYSS